MPIKISESVVFLLHPSVMTDTVLISAAGSAWLKRFDLEGAFVCMIGGRKVMVGAEYVETQLREKLPSVL